MAIAKGKRCNNHYVKVEKAGEITEICGFSR